MAEHVKSKRSRGWGVAERPFFRGPASLCQRRHHAAGGAPVRGRAGRRGSGRAGGGGFGPTGPSTILKHRAGKIGEFGGRLVSIADITGDGREEIIVSLPGEIRIYTTTIPTTRRRLSLLQGPLCRKNVQHQTMGYLYPPQLSYHFGERHGLPLAPSKVSPSHLTRKAGRAGFRPMREAASITIKELHARTGPHVRRAAKSPVKVTDRGELVAVLAGPHLLSAKRRTRTLLPEYAALQTKARSHDVLADLDAVRGER